MNAKCRQQAQCIKNCILFCIAIHLFTAKVFWLISASPSLIGQTWRACIRSFVSSVAALWSFSPIRLFCVYGLFWFGRFLLYVIIGIRFGISGIGGCLSFLLLCGLPPFTHSLKWLHAKLICLFAYLYLFYF